MKSIFFFIPFRTFSSKTSLVRNKEIGQHERAAVWDLVEMNCTQINTFWFAMKQSWLPSCISDVCTKTPSGVQSAPAACVTIIAADSFVVLLLRLFLVGLWVRESSPVLRDQQPIREHTATCAITQWFSELTCGSYSTTEWWEHQLGYDTAMV